jgi:hypothetical protein
MTNAFCELKKEAYCAMLHRWYWEVLVEKLGDEMWVGVTTEPELVHLYHRDNTSIRMHPKYAHHSYIYGWIDFSRKIRVLNTGHFSPRTGLKTGDFWV